MEMNNKIKFFIKLMIGVIILGYLISKIGFKEAFNILPQANLWMLLLIFPIFALFILLSTICVKILLDSIKHVAFWKLYQYLLFSWTVGLLLPSKIGEFSIAYFLKKEGIPIGKGLAVSMVDKLITLVLLSLITGAGLFLFFDFLIALNLLLILCGLGIIFLILFYVVLNGHLSKWMPSIISNHLNDFKSAFFGFKDKKKIILSAFMITLIRWSVNNLTYAVILLAFGIHIGFFKILIVNLTASLISLVPISINGLGIRQSVGVYLFSLVGVEVAYALNVFLIILAFTYTMAALLFIYMLLENINAQSGIEYGI